MTPDPRVSNKRLVCRDCGEPLEIVCPTHGRTVSRIVEDVPRARLLKPPRVEVPKVRDRIRDFIARHDASAPCTPAMIAEHVGVTKKHVSVDLVYLVRDGLVARVGKAQYAAVQP